ncbi:hypothetical protein ColKHC_14184 [Colletotrichum higginsianum]|nr:hypothetical protein ColKHC_14184 [Colletotrichum higginsianum]
MLMSLVAAGQVAASQSGNGPGLPPPVRACHHALALALPYLLIGQVVREVGIGADAPALWPMKTHGLKYDRAIQRVFQTLNQTDYRGDIDMIRIARNSSKRAFLM